MTWRDEGGSSGDERCTGSLEKQLVRAGRRPGLGRLSLGWDMFELRTRHPGRCVQCRVAPRFAVQARHVGSCWGFRVVVL